MIGLNERQIKNKLVSYIGFAKKSRNIIFGADKILETYKKGVIIVSKAISNNTLNKLSNHIIKTSSILHTISDELMVDIVGSDRIKVFQVLDKNLEGAMMTSLKNLEDATLE